jgi:hypothetical protein
VTLDFSRYLPRWREADFDALEGLLLQAICMKGGDEAAALELLVDAAERGAIYFAKMQEAIEFNQRLAARSRAERRPLDDGADEHYGETETGRALRLLAECYATRPVNVAIAGMLQGEHEGAL